MGASPIEAHGLQYRRCTAARALKGVGGLDEEELLEGVSHTVLGIGAGDEVRTALDILRGIAHGDARAGQLDHLEVVVVVTDGDEVLRGHAEDIEEASERTALIHAKGDELEEVVAGAEGADTRAELLLDSGLERDELLQWADGEALRETLRSSLDEAGYTLERHSRDDDFLLCVGVIFALGEDVLLGVGEDVCPMLLHEAVELGDEVGIEELGAEEALGARLEDLPAVEGHEVAAVVCDLQGFGQGAEGWGGAPRSEDDAGVVVSLGTEQGRADALGEDVLLGDQRAVNIKC